MNLCIYILCYLLVMSLAGLFLMGIDKRRAKRGDWRISERTLLVVGMLGGGFGVLLGMGLFRHKTKHLSFQILVPLACAVWAVVVIHSVSSLTLDQRLQYLEVGYPSAQVSAALDGYRIAFITDTHDLPGDELREVVRRVNEADVDLLLLGGDFPSLGDGPERSMAILSGMRATDGIYGVDGNHDNQNALFAAMERHGVTPLQNSGVTVREGLYLAGVEDFRRRSPDIAMATAGARGGDFVLLLSHNPDVTMAQATGNVDLVLSGHTHGGYVTLFGVLAPALAWSRHVSEYGQRFLSGWAESRDGADVFVSNGTGRVDNIPRVFARPQVILLTLERAEDSR